MDEKNLPIIYSYPKKFKSDVWHDFGFYMGEDGMLDKSHAICRVCHHGVRYLGNTTNLRSHLAKHKRHGEEGMPTSSILHTPPRETLYQREIGQDSPIINDQEVVSSVQLSIKSVFSRSNRGDMLNLMVGEYLIENLLPPAVVDTQSFVSLLGVADPNFRVQPSTYYTTILFNELYERQRVHLSELLGNRDVTLSIESWETINARSFVTYSANVITDSWKFDTYALSSKPMPCDLNGQILNLCKNFDLKADNIVTIGQGIQAKSASGVAIKCLGKAIDETMSHILEFGDVPSILDSVKTIDALDTEINVAKNCGWMADYEKMLVVLNGKSKSSMRDVNMQSVEAVVNALKPLKSAAEHMLDQKEVIISAVLPIMRKLELSLGDGACRLEKELKSEIWCFLKKYYEEDDVKDYLLISSLLDPRFKELLFVDIEDLKRARSQLSNVAAAMFKTMQCESDREKRQINSSAHEAMPDILFGESPIKKIKTEMDEISTDAVASTSKTDGNWLSDVVNKKPEVTKEESMASVQAEIDRYLTVEQTTSPPFLWWKSRQSVYPILSKVARQYLCTPATALSPEVIFRRHNVELNDRRRLIPEDMVDKMVFLNRNYNRLKE